MAEAGFSLEENTEALLPSSRGFISVLRVSLFHLRRRPERAKATTTTTSDSSQRDNDRERVRVRERERERLVGNRWLDNGSQKRRRAANPDGGVADPVATPAGSLEMEAIEIN